MKRIVVTGSECTGKTTLAAALAAALDCPWSPEFARTYVERVARPLTVDDVEPIARGQMAGEDAAADPTRPCLVLDTDLLSTIVYAQLYYGSIPGWIETELALRRGDLYLVAATDVAWQPDGLQRDRPHRRDEIQASFRAALIDRGLPFRDVAGSVKQRLLTSIEAASEFLTAK